MLRAAGGGEGRWKAVMVFLVSVAAGEAVKEGMDMAKGRAVWCGSPPCSCLLWLVSHPSHTKRGSLAKCLLLLAFACAPSGLLAAFNCLDALSPLFLLYLYPPLSSLFFARWLSSRRTAPRQ